MIYILAVFLPPLGLLLNGQPFSAVVNLVMIVPCVAIVRDRGTKHCPHHSASVRTDAPHA